MGNALSPGFGAIIFMILYTAVMVVAAIAIIQYAVGRALRKHLVPVLEQQNALLARQAPEPTLGMTTPGERP